MLCRPKTGPQALGSARHHQSLEASRMPTSQTCLAVPQDGATGRQPPTTDRKPERFNAAPHAADNLCRAQPNWSTWLPAGRLLTSGLRRFPVPATGPGPASSPGHAAAAKLRPAGKPKDWLPRQGTRTRPGGMPETAGLTALASEMR
jgi:hypothetical protein